MLVRVYHLAHHLLVLLCHLAHHLAHHLLVLLYHLAHHLFILEYCLSHHLLKLNIFLGHIFALVEILSRNKSTLYPDRDPFNHVILLSLPFSFILDTYLVLPKTAILSWAVKR